MSLRFSPVVEEPGPDHEEACLCSQLMPGWPAVASGRVPLSHPGVRGTLSEHADPECLRCFGSGVETVFGEDPVALNVAGDNGQVLLAVLGLKPEPYGELTLPEARRALMRARNRPSLASFARGDVEVRGPRGSRSDGAVELGLRFRCGGLSEERIRQYLDRFEEIVRVAQERGADRIVWG